MAPSRPRGSRYLDPVIAWLSSRRPSGFSFWSLAELYLARFDERLERRLAERDAKMEHRLAEGFAAVRVEMADRLSAQYRDLLRWLFVFWAGTIIPLAGLMIALIKV